VAGEAANGLEAVKMCEALAPDIAVLDISMPLLNGMEAARQIRKDRPRTKVILLTMYAVDRFILQGLRSGASAYVLKSKDAQGLLDAIKAVRRGEIYLSPGVSSAVVDAFLSRTELPTDRLSNRERQVLQLIAEGKTTKQIGEILCISAKTVESHRANTMEKLQIFNVPGLVRYAICQGLITPELQAMQSDLNLVTPTELPS
jgi:DNA-binding NarL/FixJ family response regulator